MKTNKGFIKANQCPILYYSWRLIHQIFIHQQKIYTRHYMLDHPTFLWICLDNINKRHLYQTLFVRFSTIHGRFLSRLIFYEQNTYHGNSMLASHVFFTKRFGRYIINKGTYRWHSMLAFLLFMEVPPGDYYLSTNDI